MHIRHLTSLKEILIAAKFKRAPKLFERTKGLTVAVEIEKTRILYSFANCSPEDQFNRKIGFNLASKRVKHELPSEVCSKLFAKDVSVDYTLLNPQLILSAATEYIVNNKI